MRLCFNEKKDAVLFCHETSKEYKFIREFPALLKGYPYYYAPLQRQIVYNVFQRIRKHARFGIQVDEEVNNFLVEKPKLKEIPSSFKFQTEPHEAQSIALRFLYTFGSAGLLMDPGMGKSKVVLDYIALMGFKKSFIVCPKTLMFVWEDEIETHRSELDFYSVKTTNWDSEKEGIENASVVIFNYDKAVMMESNLAKIGFQFIHIDEFLIKDPKSLRTKSLTRLSKKIPYRCGGSGTLINNSVGDAYCPAYYLAPALVGDSYSNFLQHHTVRVKVQNQGPMRERIVGFKNVDEAKSILESCSIVMTKEQWLKDLPQKKFHDIFVEPSQAQKEAYDSLSKNYILKWGEEFIEVDNPLVMVSKLYQIANGFIHKSYDEEDVEDLFGNPESKKKKRKSLRQTFRFEEQPKLKALENLITGELSEKKAILWFNLTEEFHIIEELLKKIGIKYLSIRGGEKSTGEKVRQFNKDRTIQLLVCQAKSVNYGITVLGKQNEEEDDEGCPTLLSFDPAVHTEIFYSIGFSLETYLQQQDRIHRLGQKRECNYYRLFTNLGVEHKMAKALNDKLSLKKEMLVDVFASGEM